MSHIKAEIEELNSFNKRKPEITKDDGSVCGEMKIGVKCSAPWVFPG